MNTESLEYFIKVYEKKSVTAAAKDLFITPQGLSKMIKQLELDLETELFVRGTRGVDPTEYGELLYARAKHICYLVDDIKKEIGVMSGNKGMLNLVSTYSSTPSLPVDLIFGFPKEYPNIQIKLREVSEEYNIGKLFEDEAVDAGLIVTNDKLDICNYELIREGKVVLVVSKNHHFAQRDEVSIEELENEELIVKSVQQGREHYFVSKCLESGFSPVVKYEIGNSYTGHALCKSDNLILVSVDFIEKEIEDKELRIIKLKEIIEQNIYFVTKKKPIQSKMVSLFRTYINEYILEKMNPLI